MLGCVLVPTIDHLYYVTRIGNSSHEQWIQFVSPLCAIKTTKLTQNHVFLTISKQDPNGEGLLLDVQHQDVLVPTIQPQFCLHWSVLVTTNTKKWPPLTFPDLLVVLFYQLQICTETLQRVSVHKHLFLCKLILHFSIPNALMQSSNITTSQNF